eukprot:jgi/Bigna1/76338/fgenesh1_pg.40_\
MGSHRAQVHSLLWRLLRTQKKVFRGDLPIQLKAREEIFSKFRENKSAPAEEVPNLIKEGIDADEFLLANVIQAEYNPDTGNYTQKIRPEHTREGDIPQGTPLERK